MGRVFRIACLSLVIFTLDAAPTASWAQVDEEVTDDEGDDLADAFPDEEITEDEDLEEDVTEDEDDLKGEEEPPPPPPVETPPITPQPVAPPPPVPIVDDDDTPPLTVDEIPPPTKTIEPSPASDLRFEEEEAPPPLPPAPVDPAPANPTPAATTTPAPTTPRRTALPRLDLPEEEAESVITEQRLLEHIEARANYVRLEETTSADVELGYIEEARRALGARNVVVASAALLRESHGALGAGLGDRAIQLAEAAARLSPDLSAAHWMRTRAYWAKDPTQVALIGGAMFDTLQAKLFRFRNVVSLLSNVAVLFALALLGTIALFAFVQLVKYVRYPAHDFASIWPNFVGTGEAVMLFLILIAVPPAFGFGFLPAVALTLAITMAYQSSRERVVALIMLGLLALTPAILYVAAPLVTYHGSVTDAMASAMDEAFTAAEEKRLEAHLAKNKNDYATSLILAHRLRQRGEFARAELAYEKAIRADGSSALARNNLGVVQALQGRLDQALNTFRRAASANELAQPHLNIASMAAENANFEEANRRLEQARTIDPDLTLAYTQLDGGLPLNQKLQEARIGQGLLWSRLFEADSEESLAISRELWRPIGGRLPPLGMPIVAIIAALLGLATVRLSSHLSTPCPRCGIPADRGSPAHFCAQCVSVFLTAVAVEPQVRAAKETQVRRHQRSRRYVERVLSIAAGVGQMYGSRPLIGSFLTFLFLFTVAAAVFPEGFVVNRWDIYIDEAGRSLAAGLALGCAGVLALFSLRKSFN